jgi:hypothetical protein
MSEQGFKLPDTEALYRDMAGIVADKRLECPRCKDTFAPTSSQMASYFRKGWPRCCGQTMSLR